MTTIDKDGYYFCSNCGDLTTKLDLTEACGSGGMPYCYCEFDKDRIFIKHKRISRKLWETLNELESGERIAHYRYFIISKKLKGEKLKCYTQNSSQK